MTPTRAMVKRDWGLQPRQFLHQAEAARMAGIRRAVGKQGAGGRGVERAEADAAIVRGHFHQGIKPIEASGAGAAHLDPRRGCHRGRHLLGTQGAGREVGRWHEHFYRQSEAPPWPVVCSSVSDGTPS